MKTVMKVLGKVFKVIALALYLIAALLPLYWVVVTSSRVPGRSTHSPLKYLPSKLSFESYSKLFGFANFGVYFRNSAIVRLRLL